MKAGSVVVLVAVIVSASAAGAVFEVYTAGDGYVRCIPGPIADAPEQILEQRGSYSLEVYEGILYWANLREGSIQYAPSDGTAPRQVLDGLSSPRNLHIDGHNRMLFWCEATTIRSAQMDGSGLATVVEADDRILALTTHGPTETVYWIESVADDSAVIKRANFDGSAVEDITPPFLPDTPVPSPLGGRGTVLIARTEALYFASNLWNGLHIYRAGLDGTEGEVVFDGAPVFKGNHFIIPVSFYIDEQEEAFYLPVFASAGLDFQLFRYLIGETEGQAVFNVEDFSNTRAFIFRDGIAYWSNDEGIYRKGKSSIELLSRVQHMATGIRVVFPDDASTGIVYWSEVEGFYGGDAAAIAGAIYSVNTDGTDRRTIHSGLGGVSDIELDCDNGRLYWADFLSGAIYRSTVEGDDVELLTEGLTPGVVRFALDSVNNMLYWSYGDFSYFVHFDIAEDMLMGRTPTRYNPQAIAVDSAGPHIFASMLDTSGLWRVDPESGERSRLRTEGRAAYIAVDSHNRHVYWLERGRLRRMQSDGTDDVDLGPVPGEVFALRTQPMQVSGSAPASVSAAAPGAARP